nr:hemagglutinin repeat-containing protein [Stenotrophomonas mori]
MPAGRRRRFRRSSAATLCTTEGDIALTASNIVAEGNVDVHAAGDLSIRSGQDTAGNANRSDDKAIGTVVISDTERFSGYHTEQHRDEGTQVSQVASSVGSLDSNVRLSAASRPAPSAGWQAAPVADRCSAPRPAWAWRPARARAGSSRST